MGHKWIIAGLVFVAIVFLVSRLIAAFKKGGCPDDCSCSGNCHRKDRHKR